MAIRLAALRIAEPCSESWADMTGDAHARHCDRCDREVVDLSSMTERAAEAVLARPVTPCVRFRRVAIAGALLAATPVYADTPPQPQGVTITEEYLQGLPPQGRTFEGELGAAEAPPRRAVEWSTWARIGLGVASSPPSLRSFHTREHVPIADAALGADVTFSLARHGALRVGAWGELGTTSGAGVELLLDDFRLRAGAGLHEVTAAIAYGIHYRLVASTTRGAHGWSVTAGGELDLVAALRDLF